MGIPYLKGLSTWQIVLLCVVLLLMMVEATYSIWWAIGDILIRTVPESHAFYKSETVDLVLSTSLAHDMIYFAATAALTVSFIVFVMRRAWAFWVYVLAAFLFNLDWILLGLNGLDSQPAAGYFSLAYACLLLFLVWLANQSKVCR